MNYRIVKNSKSNLMHYHFSKSIPHNKASNILLSFSKNFMKACKSVFNSLFAPTKYIYNDVSDSCKPSSNNYYFEDITDLRLKASHRTFL